jgi:hypothetical protein
MRLLLFTFSPLPLEALKAARRQFLKKLSEDEKAWCPPLRRGAFSPESATWLAALAARTSNFS